MFDACMCGDNRFEIIKKYKEKLINATNIKDSPEEMKVLDNIFFRLWQMRWLDDLEYLPYCKQELEYFKEQNFKNNTLDFEINTKSQIFDSIDNIIINGVKFVKEGK